MNISLDFLAHSSFGNPECVIPILAANLVDQTVSLPPYLIPNISMAAYLAKEKLLLTLEVESPFLKISDFGGRTLLLFTILASVMPPLT